MIIIDTNKLNDDGKLKRIASLELMAMHAAKCGARDYHIEMEMQIATDQFLKQPEIRERKEVLSELAYIKRDKKKKFKTLKVGKEMSHIFYGINAGETFYVRYGKYAARQMQAKIIQAASSFNNANDVNIIIETHRLNKCLSVTVLQ